MSSHARQLVRDFLKTANFMDTRKTPNPPSSVGDVLKTTRQKATRAQHYSQPVGKTDTTQPTLSSTQKAVPPPPVQ